MSLFAQLKRRNVFRVGAFYAVLSWLVLQVADVLFGVARLPDWSLTLVASLLALGFIPVLIFAWVFEFTPEGLRKESDIDSEGDARAHAAGKLNIALAAVLVLAVGVFAVDRLGNEDQAPDGRRAPDGGMAAGGEGPRAGGPAAPEEASIAVLAFDNMSPDPENAYFAEGISEEILNVLAQIEGLDVASRTSAFSFAGSSMAISEIAESLAVAHVLEGSVRRQGDSVRITAQLIDARTDRHLWSGTFDRELDDIFEVQEEIARSITDALRSALGVAEVAVNAPTNDLGAYQLFLRGRTLFYQRGDRLLTAIEDFRAAVERDDQFTEAWAYLAAACYVAPGYGWQMTVDDSNRCVSDAVERALALDPAHVLALAVKGQLLSETGDQREALEIMVRAAAAPSQDSTAILWYGAELFHMGYVAESVEILERAYRKDPLVGINNGNLALAYLAAGEEELALPHIEVATEKGWGAAQWVYAVQLSFAGKGEQAAEVLEQIPGVAGNRDRGTELFLAAIRDPAQREAIYAYDRARLAAEAGEIEPGWELGSEDMLALRDVDRFFEAAQEGFRQKRHRPNSFFFRNVWLPPLGPVREDPRLFALAEEMGIVSLWESRGYPPGCTRVAADPPHLDCGGMTP
jgi:TolB-like protein